MAIRGIGFDYLGVTALMPSRGQSVYERVAELVGGESAAVYEAYHRHNRGFQLGEYDQAELWRRLVVDLGQPDKAVAALAVARSEVPLPDHKILALSDRLRSNGYKVGLLSNLASGTDWDAALRAAGVPDHFDSVLLSGDLGFAKPDPKAFEALARSLEVDTDELVFIDDRPSSLAGVKTIGVEPIIYVSYEDLLPQLAVLGINHT